jgi:hypothetical protein
MVFTLKVVFATMLSLIMPFLGFKLGLRMFVFSLMSLASIFLLILFSVVFLDPLTSMVSAWLNPVVAIPFIIVGLATIIITIALKISFSVEAATENLSDPGNKAIGCGVGLGIGALVTWMILF